MAAADEDSQRNRSLVFSLKDGMAWSVMVGFGEQYVGPFALFLSAGTLQMGFLAAAPAFCGSLMQILSARMTDKIRSRLRIIVPAGVLQALLWIPIFAIPVATPTEFAVPCLIALVCLFSAAGHFMSPPWNSLMGDLVSSAGRGVYFARRNRICHVFTIASVGMAGTLLHYFKSANPAWHVYGFLTIFGVACVARLVSIAYLSMQYEPAYRPPPRSGQFTYLEFLRAVPQSNFARYALFLAVMSFSIHLAAPFFVVYLLRELQFTYLEFTAVSCLLVFSQILTLLFWGRAADRFGNKWVLLCSGLILSLAPFFLPLSTHFYYIAVFSVVAAAAGAGFNLATANYIFDAVSPPKRAQCVAYFHVTNATGVLLGGLAGGWLSGRLPAIFSFGPFHFHLASNLLTLYLISGFFRLATLLAFRSAFRELRQVEPPRARMIFRLAFSGFEPLAPSTTHPEENRP